MTGSRTRVVLDCDPGHDDAMAILLAAASPAIELVGITTVAGNQTLDKTTLNARRVCSVAGITNVAIAAGAERPLFREPEVASAIHGESGLDGPDWPAPTVELDRRVAVELIADAATQGPLTVIAVGPLTNVASLLQRRPELGARLSRVVLMGGAIGLGNRTPSAEFNIWFDPEAAEIVFRSGVPITMVPLEVTHRALATRERLGGIEELGTPVARMAVELMRFFASTYERVFGFDAPAVHDPCAVAWVVDPSTVPTRAMHVAIETRSELCRGRTDCDVYGTRQREPNALVGVDLDVDRFWALMHGALAAYR